MDANTHNHFHFHDGDQSARARDPSSVESVLKFFIGVHKTANDVR